LNTADSLLLHDPRTDTINI